MFSALREQLLSTGMLLVFGIAVVSSVVVALLPSEESEGIEYWVFAAVHRDAYLESVEAWNHRHPDRPFVMRLLHRRALERRTLSGFLSGMPVADLIEAAGDIAPKAFLGPLEQIGFLDLTERIYAEGLYEQINTPSFSRWTTRGRIFGLPHDVHPAVLAYRADIFEAAGIDVAQIETWEDYFRAVQPLMTDFDGDGRLDRYALNLGELNMDEIVGLVLQNEGQLFDADDQPTFADARNARTLAEITCWLSGPNRSATYVSTWSQAGMRQLIEGVAVGIIASDVLLGTWKVENPRMSGLFKVMPLPAWERGGRRSTVLTAGTMIGINKRSAHIEAAWEMAKILYTSREVAEATFRNNMIISPVKAHWQELFYHEPDPYYCGQAVGSVLLAAAPSVPAAPSSPYRDNAFEAIRSVIVSLRTYAEQQGVYEVEALTPHALRLLLEAQEQLKKRISRNVFLQLEGGVSTLESPI